MSAPSNAESPANPSPRDRQGSSDAGSRPRAPSGSVGVGCSPSNPAEAGPARTPGSRRPSTSVAIPLPFLNSRPPPPFSGHHPRPSGSGLSPSGPATGTGGQPPMGHQHRPSGSGLLPPGAAGIGRGLTSPPGPHSPLAQRGSPAPVTSYTQAALGASVAGPSGPGAGIPSPTPRGRLASFSSAGGDQQSTERLVFIIAALLPGCSANPASGEGSSIKWNAVQAHMVNSGYNFSTKELMDTWNTHVRGSMEAIKNFENIRGDLTSAEQADKKSRGGA